MMIRDYIELDLISISLDRLISYPYLESKYPQIKTEYNLSCLQISNQPYRMLLAGSSGLGKTNVLFNIT